MSMGPKKDSGYEVIETVDVLDRPIPNDNDKGGGRNYQSSYFDEPDYQGEAGGDD